MIVVAPLHYPASKRCERTEQQVKYYFNFKFYKIITNQHKKTIFRIIRNGKLIFLVDSNLLTMWCERDGWMDENESQSHHLIESNIGRRGRYSFIKDHITWKYVNLIIFSQMFTTFRTKAKRLISYVSHIRYSHIFMCHKTVYKGFTLYYTLWLCLCFLYRVVQDFMKQKFMDFLSDWFRAFA